MKLVTDVLHSKLKKECTRENFRKAHYNLHMNKEIETAKLEECEERLLACGCQMGDLLTFACGGDVEKAEAVYKEWEAQNSNKKDLFMAYYGIHTYLTAMKSGYKSKSVAR